MHNKNIEKLIVDIVTSILYGVGIDDCKLVSEKLAKILDERDIIKERYFLEVSSFGIARLLKKKNDVETAYGSKIDITYTSYGNTKTMTGVLVNHDINFLEIRESIKGKQFKNSEKNR